MEYKLLMNWFYLEGVFKMDSQEVKITENDVIDLVDMFTKVPAIILRGAVSKNLNVVKSFESQVLSYKDQLSEEDIVKIKKLMEMPIPEIQKILNKAYEETDKEQLKILASPEAETFIAKNLQELKRLYFNE